MQIYLYGYGKIGKISIKTAVIGWVIARLRFLINRYTENDKLLYFEDRKEGFS